MIKTPVKRCIVTDNVTDSNGNLIAKLCDIGSDADEVVKRINTHDEIVKSLTEMCEMWLFVCECNGYDENHMNQYKSAKELLERCK